MSGRAPDRAALAGARRAAAAAMTLLAAACGGGERPTPANAAPAAPATPAFRDVTKDAGIDFVHENGASGKHWFVETNGSGAAWLDFDGDGKLDLFLVQGAALPGFTAKRPLVDTLWRQVAGKDGPRFEDATAAAGIAESAHGMGAAAGDYDNDGDEDLYVTNYGTNVLWRNDGGHFTDVTAQAGVADGDRYHASCAWVDLDQDGDLDLFVVGYVDFRVGDGKVCGEPQKGPEWVSYCHPDMYEGIDDTLLRNNGDGTFTDVSAEAGLKGGKGKGLGVAVGDFDDDGDPDLFVANDSEVAQLWRNDGGLKLVDVASQVGVDFNGEGRTQAHMGASFGDVDGDGKLDLFTANLSNENNTLWINEGGGFHDRSWASGLAGPSMPMVGFGTLLADLDDDGDLDVAVANGHVLENAERFFAGTTYRQPAQLYWNDGRGRFAIADPADAGGYFAERHVGRGLACADYDDDGDLDLLFTNNREAAHLLRNERGSARSWIGFRLRGSVSTRDALGAEVLVTAGGRTQRRAVRGGESYLSSHDHRVLVGLGDATGPVDVVVRWPNGRRQSLFGLAARAYHEIEEPR